MVGDHGQIIPFRRVKGIAIALITVATLAVLAAVGLGLWGGWLRVQNAGLQSDLAASREVVRKLKDEKDLLMAKVVILESQTRQPTAAAKANRDRPRGATAPPDEKPAAETTRAQIPAPTESQAASAAAAPTTASAARAEETAPPTPPPARAKAPSSPPPLVSVNAFIADHSPRRNILAARFQIKNTGARGRKIAGRCVLVMKNEAESDTPWVSVPHVSLISGRPNGKQGRNFRIANYMTLKMQTNRLPDNFAFDTGTLYVYDEGGNQLLEKEVPVQLSYRKPAPKPSPPATAPQVQRPPEAPAETVPQSAPPSQRPSATAGQPSGAQSADRPPASGTIPTKSAPADNSAAPPIPPPVERSPTTPSTPGTDTSEPPSTPDVDTGTDPSLLPESAPPPTSEASTPGAEDAR
ncbi:MAG: hypothetical protein QNJ22_23630 [Desulfosarcinaceae bacterium]|nr:hypothetical protein [Desulfosarcinaceae bacterium]